MNSKSSLFLVGKLIFNENHKKSISVDDSVMIEDDITLISQWKIWDSTSEGHFKLYKFCSGAYMGFWVRLPLDAKDSSFIKNKFQWANAP